MNTFCHFTNNKIIPINNNNNNKPPIPFPPIDFYNQTKSIQPQPQPSPSSSSTTTTITHQYNNNNNNNSSNSKVLITPSSIPDFKHLLQVQSKANTRKVRQHKIKDGHEQNRKKSDTRKRKRKLNEITNDNDETKANDNQPKPKKIRLSKATTINNLKGKRTDIDYEDIEFTTDPNQLYATTKKLNKDHTWRIITEKSDNNNITVKKYQCMMKSVIDRKDDKVTKSTSFCKKICNHDELYEHIKQCQQIRTHKCEYPGCISEFTTKNNLRVHKQTVHGNNAKGKKAGIEIWKQYKCQYDPMKDEELDEKYNIDPDARCGSNKTVSCTKDGTPLPGNKKEITIYRFASKTSYNRHLRKNCKYCPESIAYKKKSNNKNKK